MISAPVPLSVIMDEYRSGSVQVMKKLEWLEEHGWDQVWRARGDGDCFYRCEPGLPYKKELNLSEGSFHISIPSSGITFT